MVSITFSRALLLLLMLHGQQHGILASTSTQQDGFLSVPSNSLYARDRRSQHACFVVRTYWGHGDAQGGELRTFLHSLQNQTVNDWEVLLIVVDSKPFEEVHDIVNDFDDERIYVLTEWNGDTFTPKEYGAWVGEYHQHLWNATDFAISLCSPETEWLIVTNGDNIYGKSFLRTVFDKDKEGIDLIAFDFYSRFNRPSMPACERHTPALNPESSCKTNLLKWCQTDLGSVAMRYYRFMEEGRSFCDVNSTHHGLENSNNDGLLIEELVRDGWRYENESGSCLFVHSPSIQSCAWQGGIWDDSRIETGGECISSKQAEKRMKDMKLEMVEVPIIHADNYADEYGDVVFALSNRTKCIRRRDFDSVKQKKLIMQAFGERCTHPADLDTYYKLVGRTKQAQPIVKFVKAMMFGMFDSH